VPKPQIGRTPTVGGLHRELTDLQRLVAAMSETQDNLLSEVAMLRGWMEVLMTLKDGMLVKVPELQVEMRGLRNGMDLERMKGDITALRREVTARKPHLAKAPGPVPTDSSASDADSSDDSSGDDDGAPAVDAVVPPINLPMSSMFVHPDQLRDSRTHTPAAVHRALSSDEGTTSNVPPVPAPSPITASSPMSVVASAGVLVASTPPTDVNVALGPSDMAPPTLTLTGA
jgi:hypothetical protein